MRLANNQSLFWDVEIIDPDKNARFVIERILSFGEEKDFKWAVNFYRKEKIKEVILKCKVLDQKSLSFWCQYFNINLSQCIQKQSINKQSAFLTR